MTTSTGDAACIKKALSATRISTYELASKQVIGATSLTHVLSLYAWNARVSAALLVPLHICEVVIRNAVADVLEQVYGPSWPWSAGFERSLPADPSGYSAKNDLIAIRKRFQTAGKIIPEMNLMFWQSMFTGRFDGRLWNAHMMNAFPFLELGISVSSARLRMYSDLAAVRLIRNRIAHHEPIFTRDLNAILTKIKGVIAARCPVTCEWMLANQEATTLIATGPALTRQVAAP